LSLGVRPKFLRNRSADHHGGYHLTADPHLDGAATAGAAPHAAAVQGGSTPVLRRGRFDIPK